MIEFTTDCFDLKQIAESGQCFRITELSTGLYRCIAGNHMLEISKQTEIGDNKDTNSNTYIFNCTEKEFENFWRHYFDLDTDYHLYRNAVISSNDTYLQAAYDFGKGIRILNQDPWEMLITFIISQRKNIPAICQAVEAICKKCGNVIDQEKNIFAFPTPKQLSALSLQELQDLSLGYRAKYIYRTAKQVADGELDLEALKDLCDAELSKKLLSCYGVGVKVANCVQLFGYHRIGAFPIDVWIDRIQKEHYNGHFPVERYPDFAGVLQQYMFYYERKRNR